MIVHQQAVQVYIINSAYEPSKFHWLQLLSQIQKKEVWSSLAVANDTCIHVDDSHLIEIQIHILEQQLHACSTAILS